MPIGFTQGVCAASPQAGVTSDLSCSACLSEVMRVCWTEPRNKAKYSQRLEVTARREFCDNLAPRPSVEDQPSKQHQFWRLRPADFRE
jgi:hypothetical protein